MKNITTLSFLLALSFSTLANDIQVSNVTLTGQDPNANTTMVQFDLSWENSWRIGQGPSNWDAAWIFIKFRENGGPWEHVRLNRSDGTAANDGHTQPTGSTITTPIDRYGCFIHRDADGSGAVNWTGIQLKWNYNNDGVQDESMLDIQVFAIEMVYIPQGAFTLANWSSSSTETDKLVWKWGPTNYSNYTVSSENQITVGTGTNVLYYSKTGIGNQASDQGGPIPASFPKGYNAFYVMKYEVTEEQYVNFFNTLTEVQKQYVDITNSSGNKGSDNVVSRNTISYTPGSAATTTAPTRAVGFMGWRELYSYLDWAALRPFTELEYEKMARGSLPPVQNEYAWRNNQIHNGSYIISNDGNENAVISNSAQLKGNALYSGTILTANPGPFRSGIFAASAQTKNREETGASYYGVMELSGSLFERCFSVGHADNRSFTGSHGNGSLFAIPSSWPDATTAGARAYRGGSFATSSALLRIADRTNACYSTDLDAADCGIRGARTAP